MISLTADKCIIEIDYQHFLMSVFVNIFNLKSSGLKSQLNKDNFLHSREKNDRSINFTSKRNLKPPPKLTIREN